MKQNYQQIIDQLYDLPPSEIKAMADPLIIQQNLEQYSSVINHMSEKNNGNPLQFYAAWTPMLWQANSFSDSRNINFNNQSLQAPDMDYCIAESLQSLQSGQDPEAEYNSWVEQAKKIYHDMKTEGTSFDEFNARDGFVRFLDDRETDLKRVIALYSGAAFNNNCPQQAQAQEKLKFLTFKLSELRKLRERVKNIKPTRPHSRKEQQELAEHSIHRASVNDSFVDYGNYDTIEKDTSNNFDKSAAAVALAASITAIALHRIKYQQNAEKQTNESENPNKFQLFKKLRGIGLPRRISRGFRASEYQQLLNRSDDYYY